MIIFDLSLDFDCLGPDKSGSGSRPCFNLSTFLQDFAFHFTINCQHPHQTYFIKCFGEKMEILCIEMSEKIFPEDYFSRKQLKVANISFSID